MFQETSTSRWSLPLLQTTERRHTTWRGHKQNIIRSTNKIPCTARHGTARHGTTRHDMARHHSLASLAQPSYLPVLSLAQHLTKRRNETKRNERETRRDETRIVSYVRQLHTTLVIGSVLAAGSTLCFGDGGRKRGTSRYGRTWQLSIGPF